MLRRGSPPLRSGSVRRLRVARSRPRLRRMVMPDRSAHGSRPVESVSRGHGRVRAAAARAPRPGVPPDPRRDLRPPAHGVRHRQRAHAARSRAPAPPGMEACFVNLVEPGDTVIVGVNGVFGERMCEVARRAGAEVVRVEAEWGTPIDPQALLDALAGAPGRAGARGRARGDVDGGRERRRAAARRRRHRHAPARRHRHVARRDPAARRRVGDRRLLLRHAEVSRRAARALAGHVLAACGRAHRCARTTPVQSWYLDLGLIGDYVGHRPQVPPHRAHRDDRRAARGPRRRARRGPRRGVEAPSRGGPQPPGRAPGPRVLADRAGGRPGCRSSRRPARPTASTRRRCGGGCSTEYDIEVGGGLGAFAGVAWRIGLMGHTARRARWRGAPRRACASCS